MKKILVFSVLILMFASAVYAETVIIIDKDDYVLGETVYISGVNFNPDAPIDMIISRPDDVELEFNLTSNATGGFVDFEYYLDEENAMDGEYYIYATDGVNEAFGDFWDCGGCQITKKISKYVNDELVYWEDLQTGDKWVKSGFKLPADGDVRVEYKNTCVDRKKKYRLSISGLCSDTEIGRPKYYPGNTLVVECSYSGASPGDDIVVGLDVHAFRRWRDVIEHTEMVCDYGCLEPQDIGADIEIYLGNEPSLQNILDNNGYSIDVDNDQSNFQTWDVSQSAEVEFTFLGKVAGNVQVFGYYFSNLTFVPIFSTGAHPSHPSVPVLPVGGSMTVILPAAEIGFAIDTHGLGSNRWYTEKILNSDGFEHAVVFDLCDEFVLGFEDLPESQSDKDYQDLAVSVKMNSCIYPVCGNHVLENGEECDDGNLINGDGCDENCTIETFEGFCGDGALGDGEECDDGNNNNGDGCSANCTIEEICGNGVLEDGEECDDNNTVSGDGCSSSCVIEYCGDNTVQTGLGEECDDGNNNNEDGCSASCVIEYCGDSTVQTGLGEECDDGNLFNGDGCNSECLEEGPCDYNTLPVFNFTSFVGDLGDVITMSWTYYDADADDVDIYLYYSYVDINDDVQVVAIAVVDADNGSYQWDSSGLENKISVTVIGVAYDGCGSSQPGGDGANFDYFEIGSVPPIPEFTGIGILFAVLAITIGYFSFVHNIKKK